ncbi:MAG: magnesium chelatase domain-containing protein, partial [Planctomycetota bacterium]
MIARVQSCLLQGVEASGCEVEIDLDDRGLERLTIVGLPDAAVKESLERVRSALGNAGYPFPQARVLINLAPADVRKEGPVYDLPIAVGLLIATGVVTGEGLDPRKLLLAGELALDGRLRPVKGAIAMADFARSAGLEGVVVPGDNAGEAAVVRGVNVYGPRTLGEVVGLLNGTVELEPAAAPDIDRMLSSASAPVDFGEVRGQEAVKRAIVVAAAGGH